MINELTESFKSNIKERLRSPFYGAFIVSWILWNWKVWYVTFFVDSGLLLQKNKILKTDFIFSLYNLDSFGSFFYSAAHLIILPLISTFLFVFYFPLLTCKFYEKSLDNDNKSKLIKLLKEKEFLEAQEAKLEMEEKILKKEKEIGVERIKSAKPQETIWEEEYLKLKNSRYFNGFESLKISFYEGDRWKSNIPTDMLAYYDTHNILTIDGEKIDITEKGKYFMKKYIEENR